MKLSTGAPSLALAVLLASCSSTRRELEDVAKDWCMTIRASQVLPVYPLSEDVQPGDVFVVPTTLTEQARTYEERGFLPLDQRVTRLHDLDYDAYYAPGYLDLGLAGAPKSIGAVGAGTPLSIARAAFPMYSFDVTESGGLQLALPIQGLAAGLGVMGAEEAVGSVSIRDAYTYGLDTENLLARLYAWWGSKEEVRITLADVAHQVNEPIYLRIVTRVYLTGGVTVSLTNLSTSGAGAQAGSAPELKLIDLAREDPEKAVTASEAHSKVLAALSGNVTQGTPGASVRFTQASSRSVSMDENFPRPLVIGYRGFDVKVFSDGSLSAPIPSFATLLGEDTSLERLERGTFSAAGYASQVSSELLDRWVDEDGANYDRLVEWLRAHGDGDAALTPSQLIYGVENAGLRAEAIQALGIERAHGGGSADAGS